MDFASGPNGTSHWPFPGSDVGTILLQSAMSTQHQLGSLTQGIQSVRSEVSEMREQLGEHADTLVRLDHKLDVLEAKVTAPPPAPPAPVQSPVPSLGQITISVPAYHLAAMALLAALGLAGVLTGAETKQAMLELLPKP